MIFREPLTKVLGSRPKVRLLRHLLRLRSEETGRELARALDLDHKTCHAALGDLAAQGVVRRRRAGRAFLYRIEEESFLVKNILRAAFRTEETLRERYLGEFLRQLEAPPLSAILFGSVARGEERAGSDVDLLLVVRGNAAAVDVEAAVDRIAVSLSLRFGNVPQVVVMPLSEFRRRAGAGDPFLSEVLRTGRVVKGRSLSELMKHVS